MKPDRISYKKIFPIGNYANETIGMEAQLDEGDDIAACLFDLKNRVEAFNKINNPPLNFGLTDAATITWPIPSSPIQSIDPRQKDLQEMIDDAKTVEELIKHKNEVGKHGLIDYYVNKLGQLEKESK